MSRAYDPELRRLALDAAEAAGVALRRGVYAGVAGPSLETSAERRFLRAAGGDAVGMSTVVEVIAAVHVGMRVLGLSAITNSATGGPEQAPDTIEAVLAVAAEAGRRIEAAAGAAAPGDLAPRDPRLSGRSGLGSLVRQRFAGLPSGARNAECRQRWAPTGLCARPLGTMRAEAALQVEDWRPGDGLSRPWFNQSEKSALPRPTFTVC